MVDGAHERRASAPAPSAAVGVAHEHSTRVRTVGGVGGGTGTCRSTTGMPAAVNAASQASTSLLTALAEPEWSTGGVAVTASRR